MITNKAQTVALLFGALLIEIIPVDSRERIRDENLYVRADRHRISGSYTYRRPNRESPPSPFDDISSNNDPVPNLVLLPNCDAANPASFYNSNNDRQDTTSDCDRYLEYCGKKHSSLAFDSWANYVFPEDFYDTVELMYDRCFSSCLKTLPGGAVEFCSMPEPPPQEPVDASYCFSVEDGGTWTIQMIAEEANVLAALNKQRDDPAGATCQRRTLDPSTGNVRVVQGYFPRSSPVVTNEALRCAARIQAKNIVDETIERGSFPPNLHNACPSRGDAICEKFSTRMDKAGYEYFSNGFGFTNEVTAAGYRSAEAVVAGWKGSTSGHCEAILKQESKIVPTEVGIGYYQDPISGMTGHVVILAQRNL